MVITEPMPSMPVGFWGDTDGSRYRESYFDHVSGRVAPRRFLPHQRARRLLRARPLGCDAEPPRRADRHGRRSTVASPWSEVEDALIVNLDLPGGRFFMPLFVKLRDGQLDDEHRAGDREIGCARRTRHVTCPTGSSR